MIFIVIFISILLSFIVASVTAKSIVDDTDNKVYIKAHQALRSVEALANKFDGLNETGVYLKDDFDFSNVLLKAKHVRELELTLSLLLKHFGLELYEGHVQELRKIKK